MILRPAGSSPAFSPHPPARQTRSKLSPEAMTAIGMSLALHACVGAYLFAHHFNLLVLPTPPVVDRPVIIETVKFPPPPPPSTHEKHQPPRQTAQEPIHLHVTNTLLGLDPGPAVELPSGPPGGGGQGLSQVISQPPAPPQLKPKVILCVNPDWIAKPSGAQLADAYIPTARSG